MKRFDLEKFMKENPDYEKRRQERKERKEWFRRRLRGQSLHTKMVYRQWAETL
jgi:hypothetical protein